MRLLKLIISLIIATIIIVADHKFNIFHPVRYSINLISAPIYYLINLPVDIYNTLNINKTLDVDSTKEILLLKVKEQTYNALLLENQKLSEILNASYKIKSQYLVLARVINIKQSRLKKNIIIDKGLNNGITIGNIVLSNDGVVGKVINVSAGYSTIRLITDPLQYIPVINNRNGERGIAKGVAINSNLLMIKYINPKTDIKLGDVFSTSGKGGSFNNNYPVGIVSDITQNNQNFIDISLTPMQNISNTIFVLIDISK